MLEIKVGNKIPRSTKRIDCATSRPAPGMHSRFPRICTNSRGAWKQPAARPAAARTRQKLYIESHIKQPPCRGRQRASAMGVPVPPFPRVPLK
nr:hypothetical protein [Candidatus Sigynarchaeota archaeon]